MRVQCAAMPVTGYAADLEVVDALAALLKHHGARVVCQVPERDSMRSRWWLDKSNMVESVGTCSQDTQWYNPQSGTNLQR